MSLLKRFSAAAAVFTITLFSGNAFCQTDSVGTIDSKGTESFETIIHLPQFKDKVLFIDVWGVHCEPCLEEFAFNAPLRDRFKNKAVAYVYLSLDYGHADDKERWSKMIKDKNLVGYNMFISMKTYMGLWEPIKSKISKESQYVIPHYIIVDTKKNIVFPDAERPGTTNKLYGQIQSILDKGI
jgi:thiol-disulfide isomerase/thioredoxin